MPETTTSHAIDIEKDLGWKRLYRAGAAAALLIVLTVVAEIGITFLPGGSTSPETVIDWFASFNESPFMAMRNLGLLNIIMTMLGVPAYLALYGAHRRVRPAGALLAMILAFIGLAVFLACNRAFAMLALSNDYAAATTEAQRTILAAAGEAMLAVGQSHTAGTFLGFFISGLAGLMISVVMLKGGVFSKINAYCGIVAFILLMTFDIVASFIPSAYEAIMLVAMLGGILSLVWYVLIAGRLWQLAAAE
jgi:hypothetical protein